MPNSSQFEPGDVGRAGMSPTGPGRSGELDILAGGGEMGELIRALDWSRTPIGTPESWSTSLRTAARILLDSGYPMYIAWGPKFTQIYNDAYRPILGQTKHPRALGASTFDTFAEIWDFIGPMFGRVMEHGEASTYRDQLLELNRYGFAEECYFTFSYSAIREDDHVGGVFVTVLETTERVLQERRQDSLSKLSLALSAADASHLLDSAVAAVRGNDGDLPFFAIFETTDDRSPPFGACIGEAGSAQAALVGAIASADPAQAPLVVDLPDGARPTAERWSEPVRQAALLPVFLPGAAAPTAWIAAGLSPRLTFGDSYIAYLKAIGDQISAALAEADALQAERRRAEALAEIDRAKTLFFSNVSHEFRTPLTLMLGPLEDVIRRNSLVAEDRADLEVVLRNGLRLLKLVNSLLDFSRIEAGRAQASYEPTDLAGLTADLASNFRSAVEKAGLALVVDCPRLSSPVHVDRDMWEKIVLNLVSNAFKFTFDGEIEVSMRAGDGGATLSVRDTGTGIPAHELPRLFERFHRIDGARGRSFEGSGIGLALVQELVRLHGGEIAVESKEDRGTTFTVTVPFGTAHLPADRLRAERAISSTAINAQAYVEEALRWLPGTPSVEATVEKEIVGGDEHRDAEIASARASILLADDNADMRDYIRRLLAPYHDVAVAADGQAALDAVRDRRPDILITDVMMPRLDGFGLLRAIRQDDGLKSLPVIFLSARAGQEAGIEGRAAGADDYLIKPFSARELIARVEAVLGMSRMRQRVSDALRESETRFREMADNAPVMVWTTDPAGRCTFLSRTWYDFTGQTPDTGLGFGWLDAVHPDERERMRQAFAFANREHKRFSLEYRLRRHDGRYRWAIDAAAPWLDGEGTFLGYIGSVIDIDERKRSEQHRALLVDELNHRVKNTLSIVQALAQQTFRSTDTPSAAVKAFEGRLLALATAHGLLTKANWHATAFTDLIEGAVVRACEASRVTIDGPALQLPPKVAVTFAMALHELCTNATKYGALSNETGRVAISWNIVCGAERRLHLTWAETGGPEVSPPARRGFGSRLIEQALSLELNGKVTLDYRPEGLVCTVDAPLPHQEDDAHEGTGR